eukprot:5010024-Prymnesium_polylepis.1
MSQGGMRERIEGRLAATELEAEVRAGPAAALTHAHQRRRGAGGGAHTRTSTPASRALSPLCTTPHSRPPTCAHVRCTRRWRR